MQLNIILHTRLFLFYCREMPFLKQLKVCTCTCLHINKKYFRTRISSIKYFICSVFDQNDKDRNCGACSS